MPQALKPPALTLSRIFVLQSPDGRALVAFEARSLIEAQQLRKESWFAEELAKGPDRTDARTLRARPASATEISAYKTAQASAHASEDEDLYLAYLAI